jgi:hypothetical protein
MSEESVFAKRLVTAKHTKLKQNQALLMALSG